MESLTSSSRRLRIGLTGGIGSGKSTVAERLVQLGAGLIDTDAIARQLSSRDGAAIPALREVFGPGLLGADGSLDRAAMRALVFSDATAKQKLEAVMHPLINQKAQRQAEATAANVLVFDVPLLAESPHWRDRVDRVLVIDCTTQTQLVRVQRRPGWTLEAVQRVIASQATRESRRAVADAVIYNDDIDLAGLEAAVTRLWQQWHP